MTYKVSVKARLDLIGIWEYTSKIWSVSQADAYYQIIVNKFIEIGLQPDSGKNYEDLRKGYRGIVVKSHIVFYKYQNQGTIEIVRILHQRMDCKSRIVD